MNIIDLFRTHKHYWTTPRKRPNGENVQTCYGCGHERASTMEFGSQSSDATSEALVMNSLYQPVPAETRDVQSASYR
jgi:hypothetical protein